MIEIIMLSIMMMQIEQPELPWLTPVSISVEFCDDE